MKTTLCNSCLLLFIFLGASACSPKSAEHQKKDNNSNNLSSGDTSAAVVDNKRVRQPNVVLILIDDLNHYGVTSYGANRLHSYDGEFSNRVFETPNIDKLAQGGLRVDNAFAYPICENTRIALMSGKRNDRNYLRPKAQHRSDITFGDVFKRAGYATGLFGKWKQTRGSKEVHGNQYIGEFGWDEYTAFDVITADQRYINPDLVINGERVSYNKRTDLDPETGRRWYGPDIVNRRALKFIDKNKDNPFFLYYPMILVHDDHKPTPHTQPHSIFDNFPEVADYNNTRGDDREYFPDMIEYMDYLIGKVVRKLEEHNLREDTLIVVMGDNGTKETFGHVLADGSIYPGRKGGNADNGIHVPLVLNYPTVVPSSGDKQPRNYQGLVNLTDIYPTIAEATGVQMPNAEQVDGISFWPQAVGESGEPRKYIYTWFIGNNRYTDPDVALVYAFNKNFKRYAPSKEFPEGRFFDLRTDPLERFGDRVVERRWGVLRYSGLNLESLSTEQKAGYDELGKVIEQHRLIPVTSLNIDNSPAALAINQSVQLSYQALPRNAKRQGVIWESSAPEVAAVDKFGMLTAKTKGIARISIYSWDDAEPLSANLPSSYKKDGITAYVDISVH